MIKELENFDEVIQNTEILATIPTINFKEETIILIAADLMPKLAINHNFVKNNKTPNLVGPWHIGELFGIDVIVCPELNDGECILTTGSFENGVYTGKGVKIKRD